MSDVRNLTLPELMPDGWAQQIAKQVQPKLWPSILGSAVVAALIGWASSFFTAQMMIRANLGLERTRAELQLEQDKKRAGIAAYTKLATSLDTLHKAFAAYLTLVPIASRSTLSDSLLEVGKAVRNVETAKSDPVLLKSGIAADVDACLSELNPVLAKAQMEPRSTLSHQNIDSRLEELAFKAQQEGQQITLPSQ